MKWITEVLPHCNYSWRASMMEKSSNSHKKVIKGSDLNKIQMHLIHKKSAQPYVCMSMPKTLKFLYINDK